MKSTFPSHAPAPTVCWFLSAAVGGLLAAVFSLLSARPAAASLGCRAVPCADPVRAEVTGSLRQAQDAYHLGRASDAWAAC